MLALNDFITADCIVHPLQATDVRGAITELVHRLESLGRIEAAGPIVDAVWAREQQRSTGIGDGIAVPHGRCGHVDHIVAAVGTASPPLDFKTGDGKPVNLVVLLVSPTENTALHIQALGAISRRLGDPDVRRRLRNCPDAACVHDVLCRCED